MYGIFIYSHEALRRLYLLHPRIHFFFFYYKITTNLLYFLFLKSDNHSKLKICVFKTFLLVNLISQPYYVVKYV